MTLQEGVYIRWSVCQSVGRSFGQSVGPSVRPSRFLVGPKRGNMGGNEISDDEACSYLQN